MNLLLKICLLLFSFSKLCHSENSSTLLIHKIREDFLNLEDELWSVILNEKDKRGDDAIFIVKRFLAFDQELQQLPQEILYGMELPRKSQYFLLFFSDIRVIYDLYDKSRRYQEEFLFPDTEDDKGADEVDEYQKKINLLALVHDILYDEKNNVNKTILSIQSQILPLVKDVISLSNDFCQHPHQSSQQIFYNFYNLVALAQLKAYMLSQFALMAHRTDDIGNFTDLSLLVRKQYQEHSEDLYNVFKFRMYESRKMYRCDPKYHKEGETFEQLTRLIQAHVQNEVDLNSRGTCTENCAAYPVTRSYGCYDHNSDYCRHVQPCRGNIYNCQFIESDFVTCDGAPGTHRRYSYIQYKGGRTLGQRGSCARRTVDSWWRWFVHCSYCLCYCDEPGLNSDRYFSLRPSIADVNNNWVVTGMRFVKRNRMIHIQIQQGVLLPYGYINQDSVHWKPVDDFSIQSWGAVEGEDYHMMRYLKSTMNLDQLEVPNRNCVITGAGLVLNNKNEIKLQIQVTPFNLTSGKLDMVKSTNIDMGDDYNRRGKIPIISPDIPTKSPKSTEYSQGLSTSIEFTHTDLDKDAGQTTVPFIDIQPVYSDVAVPLQSAGLYYKGMLGYGGFVGINLHTYDYSNLYNFNFPKNEDRKDDSRESFVEIVH
ncbi:uncharacterized protein LOC114329429 isoform X1 [Diabrotica virgifera virgifera]|uniref:Uncharacterized protein n=1 Tax=Diabrotica virgifera virgifera TaxID=50390 RepID=A0ABM5IJM3_DIAVI|nr:uncharacterized protein LOC114329429 isoform X1 [Diabrotica virgifera virgifera]